MPVPPNQLDPIETDFLGDMAQDDHSLHEIFGFVRNHRPQASDDEVLAAGREIVSKWLDRGWLQLAGDGNMWGAARSVADLLPLIDRLGTDVTRYFVGSPWLRLTPQAVNDVPWLRGTA